MQIITVQNGSKILQQLSEEGRISYDNLLNDMLDRIVPWYSMQTMVYDFEDNDANDKYKGTVGKNSEGVGSRNFVSSLMMPRFQCLTRKLAYKPGQVILQESVFLKIKELKCCKLLFVYIHQPNQLVRSFGSMGSGTWSLMTKPPDRYRPNAEVVEIGINSIQILTKRHNAKKRCNKNLIDDDTEWAKTVSKAVGCIPIYWKRALKSWKDVSGVSYCKSYEDYKRAAYHSGNRWNATMQYDPPCKKMIVSSSVSVGKHSTSGGSNILKTLNLLVIDFWYKTEEYDDIINERLFTTESLFSQAGGFIGIMLGVSFLQLPDILLVAFIKCRKKYQEIIRYRSQISVGALIRSMQSADDDTKLHSNRAVSYTHLTLPTNREV